MKWQHNYSIVFILKESNVYESLKHFILLNMKVGKKMWCLTHVLYNAIKSLCLLEKSPFAEVVSFTQRSYLFFFVLSFSGDNHLKLNTKKY